MLASEYRAGLSHDLFDKRVPDPGSHGGAAILRNDLRHCLRTDQVVKDRRAGMLDEDRRATIAVVSEPEIARAVSSTRNTWSASPSSRPMSAFVARTRSMRSRWFSG